MRKAAARALSSACRQSEFLVGVAKDEAHLLHGTCVALGSQAALLRGPSGSGKSDLALRFLFETPSELDPCLIADDQVWARVDASRHIILTPPEPIRGRIEVRGIGIVDLPFRPGATLSVIVDLVPPENVPRLPPESMDRTELLGLSCPLLKLAPFEASAPLKLRLALQSRNLEPTRTQR
jgi:HPr kinase/phosphorylase